MDLRLAGVAGRHPAATAGARAALMPLTLSVASGETLAVIGPSGAGKTTLLQLLACSLVPAAGELRIGGVEPWRLPRRDLQKLRGRLFLAPQVPPLPPRQRVVTALLAARLPSLSAWASLKALLKADDLAGAHAALARFDLADKLFERVDRLSGGERQRVALARALLSPGRLWLVDEPLSALDPTHARQAVSTLVHGARERGATLVATLHQVDAALEHFPRIVGLREGQLAFDLPPAQVSRERLAALYQNEAQGAGVPPPPPEPTPRPRLVARC
jgi:phosphonate transport system ATP-binding protein